MANLFKARFYTEAPKKMDLIETREITSCIWDYDDKHFGMRIIEIPQAAIGRQLQLWSNHSAGYKYEAKIG